MGHEVAVTAQCKEPLVPGYEELDVRTYQYFPPFNQAQQLNTDILLMTATFNPVWLL